MGALAKSLDDYFEQLNLKGSYYLDIYLNGKLLNWDEIETPFQYFDKYYSYNELKQTIGRLIPEDSVFLNLGPQYNFEGEEFIFNLYKNVEFPVYIFSETLYLKNKKKEKVINLNNYKLLEEKGPNKIDFYCYPQGKEEKDYFSIILFGDSSENKEFITLFLNYLLDIQLEDNYRFIPEELISNKKNFINIININTEKGNFKFNCINTEVKYCKKDIEKFLDILKLKNILFCFNSLDTLNNDNEFHKNDDFTEMDNFVKIFSECEHIFMNGNYSDKDTFKWIFLFYQKVKNNKYDMIEFNKTFKNCLFISKKEIIKAAESKYFYIFLLERMSSFYEAVINNSKISMDFSLSKSILSFLLERSDNFIDIKYWKDFLDIKERKKFELKREQKFLEEKIERYKYEKEQLEDYLRREEIQREKIIENEISALNNEIRNNNSYFDVEIENIRRLETVIKKNRSFLIPSSTKILDQKKCENSYTNVCKICKYNCHKNCSHLFKSMCSCFDWSFNCKFCPNKCSTDAHEITKYEYPNYDYFNIYDIMKKYDNNFNKIPNLTTYMLITKMEEKRKEKQNNLMNKISKLQEIKSISLIDDINENFKKHFENKENVYDEIKNIDIHIKSLREKIKNFPIIDEINEVKKLNNNVQNMLDEITKIDKDIEETLKKIDLKYTENKDYTDKEINEFNTKMKNILITWKDKSKNYDLLISEVLYHLFKIKE